MVEFKKGYWNLEELIITEWIDKKQLGFMKFDVEILQKKVLEVVHDNETRKKIKKLFGFEESKE